jgi:hypothetical protein
VGYRVDTDTKRLSAIFTAYITRRGREGCSSCSSTNIVDGADSDHNSYHHALPERYENDKFDTQELPYRFEWSEFFL